MRSFTNAVGTTSDQDYVFCIRFHIALINKNLSVFKHYDNG
ncbi:hypothetical protein JCM19237_6484 [Photobacterium aphoticum]|uniref:Uncharacterized protein n=1 Tax=Photobacterium aphoticum TaxID=754436 RepID=A0A090QKD0_9GAMM|nr:hypothetical protein JCM19237_6484 [Photobacterium aphoticum]